MQPKTRLLPLLRKIRPLLGIESADRGKMLDFRKWPAAFGSVVVTLAQRRAGIPNGIAFRP